MIQCLLKEQYLLLFKFLLVSLIFSQTKKNIKKNEIPKKLKSQKRMNENFFSEFENFRTQCQCQTMSVSHNIRI